MDKVAIARSIYLNLVDIIETLLQEYPIYICAKCQHVSTDQARSQACQRSQYTKCPDHCQWERMRANQALSTQFHLFDTKKQCWTYDATIFDKLLAIINGKEDFICP